MIGWPIDLKCAVACLPSELSQQPMWPQVWHIRRWTQRIPSWRHSSQPSTSSGRSRYWTESRWEHSVATRRTVARSADWTYVRPHLRWGLGTGGGDVHLDG